MADNESALVGILLGKASDTKKAEKISGFFTRCPYCALSTCMDDKVISVFAVPQQHKWWLDAIEEQPQGTVGFQSAEVFYANNIKVESRWSTGRVRPELDKAPCGADCIGCPVYKKACPGCPATKDYQLPK
jgi:hypothetical protein